MKNSMVLFTFSILYWQHRFWYTVLGTALIFLNISKIFISYESIFCLKQEFDKFWLNFLYKINQSFANETEIDKFHLNC